MGAGTTNPPATFDQRLASGEFGPGGYGAAVLGEANWKRADILRRGGFEDLPPDIAELALQDEATARARRARSGSNRSALGMALDWKPDALGDAMGGW